VACDCRRASFRTQEVTVRSLSQEVHEGQVFTIKENTYYKKKHLCSSRLSLPNKLLLYKSILKPIWTYGIQLGHIIHIPHRDPRTFSIKGFAHNRRCTVVCAENSHPSGPPNDFRQSRNLPLKQPILHSSHHTSKGPIINPHGDPRQQAFAKTRAKRSA
jgi:hypothetical protein